MMDVSPEFRDLILFTVFATPCVLLLVSLIVWSRFKQLSQEIEDLRKR